MSRVAARLLVFSLLVVALSCGERVASIEPGGPSPSYDGTWKLIEGHGPTGDVPIVAGYHITLTIEGESIGGTAACNAYGGEVTLHEGSFDMRHGSINEMGCRTDVGKSETDYMAALMEADAISRDGDSLTLTGDDTELRFEIMPPIPTAKLIETRWELITLIHGPSGSGTATSAAPATLLLERDGTVIATTGCRDLHGEWMESGDEILFTTLGAEGNCPEELREQDDHVVNVLGDGFAPTIEEDRLTLLDRGGQGLEYRATK